jgi:hypothetical protein
MGAPRAYRCTTGLSSGQRGFVGIPYLARRRAGNEKPGPRARAADRCSADPTSVDRTGETLGRNRLANILLASAGRLGCRVRSRNRTPARAALSGVLDPTPPLPKMAETEKPPATARTARGRWPGTGDAVPAWRWYRRARCQTWRCVSRCPNPEGESLTITNAVFGSEGGALFANS